MKRLLVWMLAAVLLTGCAPAKPTEPVPTTEPTATTTAPPEATTLPPETTLPMETTLPPTETARPVAEGSYTVRLEDPELAIYDRPSFLGEWTAWLGEAGIYTIVEEAADRDGNTWGRLKSGIGWVCLEEEPYAPIRVVDATAISMAFPTLYQTEETEYVTRLIFHPQETLTQVEFQLLTWEEAGYQVDTVLAALDTMEDAREANVVFWGDMTTYGISFLDETGNTRRYALTISGKDGSLLCNEY